jgi:AcrR family transcriptional regulator
MLQSMTEIKGNRREMYAAQTRAAVLEAARELFAERGFEATSVDDIARVSQSSKGAVYHHIRDKQEMFAEVFVESQEAVMLKAVASMPQGNRTAWESIELATKAFLQHYVAHDEARTLLRQALGVLGWDRMRDLDQRAAFPMLRATLEEAIGAGDARPVPVEAAAELLFSMFCNAVLFIAASNDADKAASEVESVVLMLLTGLRAPSRGRPIGMAQLPGLPNSQEQLPPAC